MSSGGAQHLRVGDRIRVLQSSNEDTHYLRGLEGKITSLLHYGVVVALDNDPISYQRVMGAGGVVGPKSPNRPQRIFQFCEVEKL